MSFKMKKLQLYLNTWKNLSGKKYVRFGSSIMKLISQQDFPYYKKSVAIVYLTGKSNNIQKGKDNQGYSNIG